MKSKFTTHRLVTVALLAALTAVGSALRITIPMDIAGNTSFHLGNIFCALSGLLLGPWFGGLASGLGSMIYDMTNPMYISECWLTFLMKGALGLVAGLVAWSGKKENWNYPLALAGSAAGACVYALLYLVKSFCKTYFIKGVPLDGTWVAVAAKIPATLFNAVVAIIIAPILAIAIREGLKRAHIEL